ncbi:LOW QUALITY PROTEIN: uncharacterized protein LOC131155848 [Malania oleifera]|uniref:LOW QUALITY PROTEIN: uncharacterized protein LOC131155848 n=1 Tax=Malania oleifera TaxID=397392 RepID=UPI0025AE20F4|nr:LOW QUALITY PROTEIN: uncharacterized protein LOC131155848 [Malania oleifera]
MKAMQTLQDLVEEAKVRTLYWALCIFAVSYFLSHTSKSMWMNVPISLLLVSFLHLRILTPTTTPPKWKRKIDSPVVEAAAPHELVNQIKFMQDFVVILWYSFSRYTETLTKQTPDIDADQINYTCALIMDVLGEISGRVKELNLVDLLTRFSVLQRLVGGVLAVVLSPRRPCPPLVVRCMLPRACNSFVLHRLELLASPAYINELIELLFLTTKDDGIKDAVEDKSLSAMGHQQYHFSAAGGAQNGESTSGRYVASANQGTDKTRTKIDTQRATSLDASGNSLPSEFHEKPMLQRSSDWARVLDAATQRRTEVLMPENLENLWSRGRNYKKKVHKSVKGGVLPPVSRRSGIKSAVPTRNLGEEMLMNKPDSSRTDNKAIVRLTQSSEDLNNESPFEDTTTPAASEGKSKLKRSSSTSALKAQPNMTMAFGGEGGGPIISEFYSPNFSINNEEAGVKNASDIVVRSAALRVPKLRCRVIGAYFEKIKSKSFAVYSIAVTDADKKTWFVKRRYRNFERLHRQLKDIPNYTLHLPPKRIFSSSTEDAFVHQRCIQLDKYLQDLLSIANVAEQHEVWDFLSVSSMNYSFGKSSSVMRTLAVNVDDAVDDIVRQFKEVSDGLVRKVVGSSHYEVSPSILGTNLSWNSDDMNRYISRHSTMDTENSFSDNEEGDKDESHGLEEVGARVQSNGWHSDNELNSKSFPPRVTKRPEVRSLDSGKNPGRGLKSELIGPVGYPSANFPVISDPWEDPVAVPPEWTPPNVSVPLLNLVDKIFQLKRRGWLRRQVFWISKQILQLVMEDAIDDFLLRQIHWLRRDDVIAEGIRWVQDVLWPNGTFLLKLENSRSNIDDTEHTQRTRHSTNRSAGREASKLSSFELQLEASRRASDVKKMIFDGTPSTLVSLIGQKQYKRCAKDIYYFLQSTVCVKQLAYGILELVLISVFPELRDLVLEVHEKMRAQLL